MPEYLAPGVYIEEVNLGPVPIQGVQTSAAGLIGLCQNGPVNTPTLITSPGRFRRRSAVPSHPGRRRISPETSTASPIPPKPSLQTAARRYTSFASHRRPRHTSPSSIPCRMPVA